MQRATTLAMQKVHFLPEILCTLNIYNHQNKLKKKNTQFGKKSYFILYPSSPPPKTSTKDSINTTFQYFN